MSAKDVKIWYGSVALLIASVFPFFYFMYRSQLKTLAISLAAIAVTTVLYVSASKRITHPKYKYTALQAMKFAQRCCEEELTNGEKCSTNKEKFLSIAAENEFSAGLKYIQLIEMYQIGKKLNNELKGRK